MIAPWSCKDYQSVCLHGWLVIYCIGLPQGLLLSLLLVHSFVDSWIVSDFEVLLIKLLWIHLDKSFLWAYVLFILGTWESIDGSLTGCMLNFIIKCQPSLQTGWTTWHSHSKIWKSQFSHIVLAWCFQIFKNNIKTLHWM